MDTTVSKLWFTAPAPSEGAPEEREAGARPRRAPGPAPIAEEERRLIAACQQGERAAMHLLYQRYVGRVRALLIRIAGPGNVDELTQEVFLKVLRGIGGFRGESQLSTWLYRLTVNAALSHAAKDQTRRRQQVDEGALHTLPADGPGPGDPLLHARLSRALDVLPPGYRAVLVLHDVEGLQHEEIAEILGVQVGTSKSQLHKARARMRDLLEQGS